jgi:hypothetical protein
MVLSSIAGIVYKKNLNQAICGKTERKKNIAFRNNVVVAATFLDFQANIFPLLFKPRDRKFLMQRFRTRRF